MNNGTTLLYIMNTPSEQKIAQDVLDQAQEQGELAGKVGQEIIIDPVTKIFKIGFSAGSALLDAIARTGETPYGSYKRWYRGIIRENGETILNNVGETRVRAKKTLEQG